MEFLSKLANTSPDYFISIDSDFNITWANESFLNTFNRSNDIYGKKCFKVLRNRNRPCRDCPLASTLEGGTFDSGMFYPEYNTKYYYHTYPINANEKVTGVLAIFSDRMENRVHIPQSNKELSHKTQNSLISTCAYLMELGGQDGPRQGRYQKRYRICDAFHQDADV